MSKAVQFLAGAMVFTILGYVISMYISGWLVVLAYRLAG
jgi:hypothetical protein